jgi:hypothetical protein
MTGKYHDLTGRQFTYITALRYAGSDRGALWLCHCRCGEEVVRRARGLVAGETKSCGCLNPTLTERDRAESQSRRDHPREYSSWRAMTQRCDNPLNPLYPLYGAIGVTVCEQWRDSFQAFLTDMGPRPPGTCRRPAGAASHNPAM